MRVIHFGRTSDTGHVVPRCGAWGSMDTAWTDAAAGVTCAACRGAVRDDARDLRAEEASTRRSARATRGAPGRVSYALRYAGAALIAWLGAWALPAVSDVLPAADSRAATVMLWITVALLVLSGGVLAALAGKELGRGTHPVRGEARG